MFNNSVIVVIVIVIMVLYLLFTSSSKKEGFVDPSGNVITLSNVSSMDDRVAINTLAQISKNLMSGGGLTIPGDVNITGKTRIGSDTTITGKTLLSSTDITGATNMNGATNITGATNINGATMDLSGNLKVNSITIGGVNGKYTLSYDSTDKALKISNGVDTATTPVKLTLGDKCKLRAEANGNTAFLNASNLYSDNVTATNIVRADNDMLIKGRLLTEVLNEIGGRR